MTGAGGIVEIQTTAETAPFSRESFSDLLALAEKGIAALTAMQKEVLGL